MEEEEEAAAAAEHDSDHSLPARDYELGVTDAAEIVADKESHDMDDDRPVDTDDHQAEEEEEVVVT